MVAASEFLRPHQRVSEVEQQPRGDDGSERVIEGHGAVRSESVAGVGVADRQREQANSECWQDEIEHGLPPSNEFRSELANRPWTVRKRCGMQARYIKKI